jgi:drug/metabolite transporter (DMT)-like permease
MRLLTLRGERLKADLTLLAAAIVWGSAFAACRVAAEQLGPFLYNGLRFALGALTLLPFMGRRLRNLTRLELWGGMLAGTLLFGGSTLQQKGLQFTTAGKAGFITGLYVVLVPLFLALVWRQRPRWSSWVASLVAAAGLYLLSAVEQIALSLGDVLELAGAVVWALHVILISRLAQRVDVLRLAWVQCVVCAVLSLAFGLGLESHTLAKLVDVWWAIAYTGVFSVGLGYTLQMLGQRHAPPADASVILSMESVFAALAGWLMLGETLTAWQLLGCGLMLVGMLLAQAGTFAQRASRFVNRQPEEG